MSGFVSYAQICRDEWKTMLSSAIPPTLLGAVLAKVFGSTDAKLDTAAAAVASVTNHLAGRVLAQPAQDAEVDTLGLKRWRILTRLVTDFAVTCVSNAVACYALSRPLTIHTIVGPAFAWTKAPTYAGVITEELYEQPAAAYLGSTMHQLARQVGLI